MIEILITIGKVIFILCVISKLHTININQVGIMSNQIKIYDKIH